MLVEPTPAKLLHIAQRLRDLDRRECMALLWTDDEVDIARHAFEWGQPSWIACARDGEPVYAFGLVPQRPGCWGCWGFGTERWPEVARMVSRHLKRHVMPGIRETGAHRVELLCLADKLAAHKWLRWLDARECIDLPSFGRNREDFKLFVWRT